MSSATSRPAPSPISIRGTLVRVRRRGRVPYAGLAAALLGCTLALIVVWDAARWQTVALGLGPDVAVLYGVAPGLTRGQMHSRAVPLYNALHRFWGPLGLAMVAFAAGLSLGYIAGAFAWATHVAFDRAIGLRLRLPDGFQQGHRKEGGFDAIDEGRRI